MKVALFSPLPPARTGVADYAASLLTALRRDGTVDVGADGADVCLYQLGNNHLHADIYRRALERPGVVTLHDAVLHHFFLGALDEKAYTAEFVYNYGSWSGSLAQRLWRSRARSAADPRYFEYPMLRRIAETSRAVVVHNPAAAALVRAHAPGARVHEIPHLWDPRPLPPLRSPLAVPGVLFGVYGHLRESKRLFSVLEAFRRIRAAVPDAFLLVAGEPSSTEFARAVEPLLAAPGILRRPFVPEPEFSLLLAAADTGISLRYPAAGETSGITIRLMGLGKPVLVTRGEETARFPEDACVRIDAGITEPAMLADAMLWLARDREARLELGRRARAHIHEFHSPERAACSYWEVLRAAAGR